MRYISHIITAFIVIVFYAGITVGAEYSKDQLNAIIKQNPSDAESHCRLGLCYMEDDECTKAIEEFEIVIGLRPEVAEPYLFLGQCNEKQNNIESAFIYYEKFTGITKNKSELKKAREKLSQIGLKLFEILRPALDAETDAEKRIGLLKKAVMYNPSEVRYFDELASIYESKGKFEEAADLIQRRLAIVDEDKDTRYKLKQKLANFKKTVAWISKMNSENSAKSHGILGKYYSDYDKNTAERHFELAISIDPKFVLLYPEMGMFYLRNGKLSKAEESFEKYIELEEDTGKQTFARKFITAIELEKKAKDAKDLNELGVLYSKLDAVKAISVFERLVREFPDDKQGLNNLASIYEKSGRNEEALEVWSRYSELNPGEKEAKMRVNRLEKYLSVYRFDSAENIGKFWKDWRAEKGNWKIDNGMLNIQGDGALSCKRAMKNSLSFKLRTPKSDDWWMLTVALNSKENTGDGYRCIITRSNVQIKKNWQLVADKSGFAATPEHDKEYTVKAINDGNNINFYVDNKPILSIVKDEQVTGDKVGIMTDGSNLLRIESIKIE